MSTWPRSVEEQGWHPKAFAEGETARRQGRRLADNPHDAGFLRADSWEKGWLEVDRKMRGAPDGRR
ncbi:MAG: hypothetical protein GY719_26180 [bacterium]|nr:hypothetical protein [bacterium]